jgi:hypothetical protein
MPLRLVHLWSARAKQAVMMRMPSSTLLRRAASFLPASHAATALDLHHGQGEQYVHSCKLATSSLSRDQCRLEVGGQRHGAAAGLSFPGVVGQVHHLRDLPGGIGDYRPRQ